MGIDCHKASLEPVYLHGKGLVLEARCWPSVSLMHEAIYFVGKACRGCCIIHYVFLSSNAGKSGEVR